VRLLFQVVAVADHQHLSASEDGESLGYIAEEPKGFLGILSRQMFATHRPFRAVIMDNEGIPVLWECLRLFTRFMSLV
jgi:hypothetical protein